MRIGYIILAHRLPGQLGRLVKALDDGAARFLVHVDSRVDPAPFAASIPGDLRTRVSELRRERAEWGSFGVVAATLGGMRRALELVPAVDYVVLLSGQSFPLRPPRKICEALEAVEGVDFLEHYPLPVPYWAHADGGAYRFDRYWVEVAGRRVLVPAEREAGSLKGRLFQWALERAFPLPRRLPPGLGRFGGSQWWALTRDTVSFLVRMLEDRPDIIRFFRQSHIPDEIFFQSILAAHPERRVRLRNDDLHFIRWDTSPRPGILGLDDLPTMLDSGDLFARKFDSSRDAVVLDALEARIRS